MRLNFYSIGIKKQLSKIDHLFHSIPLILLATMVLFLMNILPSLIRRHCFLSPAILICVNSAVAVLNLILNSQYHHCLYLSTSNLITVL